MCRTYHVTIYTPFLIALLSSCYQAAQITSTSFSPITNDSSVNNESTETNFTTVPTTTDFTFIPDVQNLTAVAINSSSVELTWDVSTGAPQLNEFIITWTKLSNSSTSKNTTVNGTNQIVIENLDAWTEYRFIVAVLLKDHDEDLRSSANTTAKTGPSAPSQPEIYNITSENTSIFLEWKKPVHPNGPLDGYIIILETEENKNLDNVTYNSSTTSHIFKELCPWTNYTIILNAFNEWNGRKLETKVNTTVQTSYGAPSEPRDFEAIVNSSRAILLSWKDPENPNGPLDGFRINCYINKTLVKNIIVSGENRSCIIYELKPWKNYSFSIAAYNSELFSEEVNTSERTAPEAPSHPLEFRNVTYEPYKVKLQWQKPTEPNGPIDGYTVTLRTNTEVEHFNTSNTSLTLENLRSWTVYEFHLSAFNTWNENLLRSKEIKIDVETKSPESFGPYSLDLIPYNSSTMNVTWKPDKLDDHNITGYNVTWNKSNECNESYVASDNCTWKSVNSAIFLISDLDPATNYAFYVYAFVKRRVDKYLVTNISCEIGRTEDDLPVYPTNVSCHNSSGTSITIKWEEPSEYMGDIINYTVNYYKRTQNSAKKNENTEAKILTFNGLEPYTEYEFRVSAWTSKGQGKWSNLTTCRTSSSQPNSITNFKVSGRSSTSLNVTWSPPEPFPGPTNYTITLSKLDRCNKERRESASPQKKIGYDNNNISFYDLEPYTKYIVDIQVSTEIGNSLSSVEEETLPDRPSEVTCLKVEFKPTNISINWKIPEKPNGSITEFFISYVEVKNGKKSSKNIRRSQLDLCEVNTSYNAIIDQLLPEHSYKFSIYAKVDDTKGGFIDGKEKNFNCTLPAGWPPFPKKNITIVEKSKDQITFELCKDTFSNRMGAIIEYAVIVEKADQGVGESEQGDRNTSELSTWYDFVNNKDIKYQATPRSWNPFNVGNNDSMNCKPAEGKIQCILGHDKKCEKKKNKTYCNGPLKPGILYNIKIRGYTKAGFAETPPIYIETETEETEKAAKSNIIVAVVVCLLFLMLLVTGVFIYKKFGIINRVFGKTVMETSTETNDISFMSVIAKSRPVKLREFASHVSAMMADSALRFSQEFEELKSISPSHSCSVAQMQENKLKNRWINILPFDHSRVKLLPMDDEPGSDYINASYIPGFNSHREYIATQGPLPNTIDDMWRMIWEHGISMIVMLTQCVERGKTKCEQYWPPEKEEATYGDLKVETIYESILSNYTIRSFNVSLGEKQRAMTQMHFTKWPDFGCPENSELLINFVRTVRDRMIENDRNPILVHCSAGVGRTGTFIAVNRLAKHIELYDVVDVFHIVLDMRQHRTNMVQTEDQYIYIHECVRDLIQEKLAKNNESYKNDEAYENLGNHTTNI